MYLSEHWYSIIFPISFPHKAFSVNVSISPTSGPLHNGGFVDGGAIPVVKKSSLTNSGVVLGGDGVFSGASLDNVKGDIWWEAIGY